MGGRGGTAESAAWVQGFLKSAGRNADDEDYEDIRAARDIHKRLTRAKDESKVAPRGGWDQFIEGRVLKAWTAMPKKEDIGKKDVWQGSNAALYNEKTYTLTISPGKLGEARREFEQFVRFKYRKYYKRGTAVKKK